MINICFHGIGRPHRALEPGEDRYWISPNLYARVLDEVAGRADVALSFDDGNDSDIEIALPGLLERGRVATFFVLAGRLDRPGSLATSGVAELRRRGMGVGSHGMDHIPWRSLSADQRQRELVEARQQIGEAAGTPVHDASLPLGRYGRVVLRELRRLRYRRVFSSDQLPARPNDWLQPRFSIRADDTLGTVRTRMLTPPSPRHRLGRTAKGLVKRLL